MVEQHSAYIFIYLLCTRMRSRVTCMCLVASVCVCMCVPVCVRACICDQKNCMFEVLLLEDLPLV